MLSDSNAGGVVTADVSSSGLHYLKVGSSQSWNVPGVHYQVKPINSDTSSSSEYYWVEENEPNDSAQSAQSINLGNRSDYILSSPTDKDWFKFTVPSAGNIKLTFDVNEFKTDGPEYTFRIQDVDAMWNAGTLAAGYCASGDSCGPNVGPEDGDILETNVGEAGTYYIEVTDSSQNSSAEKPSSSYSEVASGVYAISVEHNTSGGVEREEFNSINNDVVSARPSHPIILESGDTIKDNLIGAGDNDVYVVVASGSTSKISVRFRATEWRWPGVNYEFSILDSQGNVLTGSDGGEAKGECANNGLCDSHSSGDGQVISAPISAAGNYWIKVDAGNAARVPGNEYFVNVVLE